MKEGLTALREMATAETGGGSSVSVVIPSYNMAWCIERAVRSCQNQSLAVTEIIVVDDCSTDDTEAVVRAMMVNDPRIRYCQRQKNSGHLAALRYGAREARGDWVALLDADDELTPNSIEARVLAANRYTQATGAKPQLVYGDHLSHGFSRQEGYVFPYLCKELCLCQTSTMMLGREGVAYLPVTDNWNTDDEIVLAIGKHFHVLHSGQAVTIYHSHVGPTRMSNNAGKVFEGVYELVRDHRADIVREQGIGRLFLWWLRVLKAFFNYQIAVVAARIPETRPTVGGLTQRLILRAYRRALAGMSPPLRSFLKPHFDNDFF